MHPISCTNPILLFFHSIVPEAVPQPPSHHKPPCCPATVSKLVVQPSWATFFSILLHPPWPSLSQAKHQSRRYVMVPDIFICKWVRVVDIFIRKWLLRVADIFIRKEGWGWGPDIFICKWGWGLDIFICKWGWGLDIFIRKCVLTYGYFYPEYSLRLWIFLSVIGLCVADIFIQNLLLFCGY